MKRRAKPRPMLSKGATRAEDLLKPEGKRESLEQYQERMTLGHQYAAEELAAWEAFTEAFPLPPEAS